MPRHLTSDRPSRSRRDDYVDFAVVGGGVAGLYCAWRLGQYGGEAPAKKKSAKLEGLIKDRRGELKIHVYECGDRVGGRLDSQAPPGMPHLRAEMGGMRYLTTQLLVSNLVKELQLESRDFPMGDENNLFYLRRRHLRASDFRHPEKVPYALEWNEQGKSPTELMIYAIKSVLPRAPQLKPREWEEVKRTCRVYNHRLYDIGFWNLLYYILSSEAYNLVLDAGGYHSILSNWNAGEAMEWFLADFPPDATYKTLVEGFDRLPKALAEGFDPGGDRVHLRHKLLSFRVIRDEKELRECGFNTRKVPEIIKLHFERELGHGRSETVEVFARHLILAMPRRSLELLESNEFLSGIKPDIESVEAQAASKLFIGYEYAWWRVLGLSSGRSITDLPIRQTYYFGTEGERGGADVHNDNSLVMASYHDGPAVGFWKGMCRGNSLRTSGGRNDGRESTSDWWFKGETNLILEEEAEPRYVVAGYEAPKDMVKAAHYQLKQLHGIESYIPKPYTALYKDWGEDPFGGGWHFWKLHVEPWKVMKRMRKQRADTNVYICGEAYSKNQGWVEGALTSAELLLECVLGLDKPHWLPDDYYLGAAD